MTFKTCSICNLTYNTVFKHNCAPKKKKIQENKEDPVPADNKVESTGFKAYCERFGIKKLKLQ